MRLSKQGKCFLMEHSDKNDNNDDCVSLKCNTLSDLEFEAKHFEGVVVLTIDEACEILDYLSYLHLRGGRDSFLKDLEKCNRNLYERIEQAEKCDANH